MDLTMEMGMDLDLVKMLKRALKPIYTYGSYT